MDSLLFHPKIVHVPVALAALMPLITGALLLAWWTEWLPRRAWWIAVALQAVLVGSAVLALESGEDEEDRVEHVVAEHYIEEHEEAAEVFVRTAGVTLAVTIAAAVIPAPGAAIATASVATVATVLVLALGYRTGEAGGELVYKHGAAGAYVGADGAETGQGEGGAHFGGSGDSDSSSDSDH